MIQRVSQDSELRSIESHFAALVRSQLKADCEQRNFQFRRGSDEERADGFVQAVFAESDLDQFRLLWKWRAESLISCFNEPSQLTLPKSVSPNQPL